MANQIDLIIDSQDLLTAGKQLSEPYSPLSPFRLADDGAVRRKPSADLVSGDGTLRAEVLPAFQTLANAASMGNCVFMRADALLDISFYYPAAGSQLAVSLSMADDGIKLQSPPDLNGILEWLKLYIGDSLLRSCDLDADLPIADAHMLFGVVDAGRRQMFSEMGGARTVTDTIPLTGIVSALEQELDDFQWLAPHFAESFSLSPISEIEVKQGLQRLAQKGYLQFSGDFVVPADALLDLISDFLLVNGHLRLRSAAPGHGDQLTATELRGVQGAGSALLLWTDDGTSVHLMGASPAQMMVIIRDILADPNAPSEETVAAMAAEPSVGYDQMVVDETVKGRKKKREKRERKQSMGKKRRWWIIPIVVLVIFTIILFLMWFFA